MGRKTAGILAAAYLAAVMTAGVSAQGLVRDVIDGAEDIIDGAGDAADDILGGDESTDNENGNDSDGTETPDPDDNDNDIPEVDTDNDEDDIVDDDSGEDIEDEIEDDVPEDEEDEEEAELEEDANPSTGSTLMAAGLIAAGAAGVAYLTKRRNNLDDEDELKQ